MEIALSQKQYEIYFHDPHPSICQESSPATSILNLTKFIRQFKEYIYQTENVGKNCNIIIRRNEGSCGYSLIVWVTIMLPAVSGDLSNLNVVQ